MLNEDVPNCYTFYTTLKVVSIRLLTFCIASSTEGATRFKYACDIQYSFEFCCCYCCLRQKFISDVDKLKTRLVDEWAGAQFDQSIVDAVSASGIVV